MATEVEVLAAAEDPVAEALEEEGRAASAADILRWEAVRDRRAAHGFTGDRDGDFLVRAIIGEEDAFPLLWCSLC